MKSPLILDDNEVDVSLVKQKTKTIIPNNYVPVYLKSNGVFDAPKILHFRDYSMEEVLKLDILEEDERLKVIVDILNEMVYEDFDCGKLTRYELMQILYTIHLTFINNKLEKEYIIDEDLPEGQKEGERYHKSNIAKVELEAKDLFLQDITKNNDGTPKAKKFKDPFTITDNVTKSKVKIRCARLEDIIFANEFCKEKYGEKKKEFRALEKELQRISEIEDIELREEELELAIEDNEEHYKDYRKFIIEYNSKLATTLQTLLIVEIDDVKLEAFEEKQKAYKEKISGSFWETYDNVLEEHKYGLIEEVKFWSDIKNQEITRRFLFQLMEFLPDNKKKDLRRFSVSFD